uniref:Uncharacterized protein n=1 Tax=Romanomermis culicivorax TaxID=13658 RepID=A0A915K1Q3_ROMCU
MNIDALEFQKRNRDLRRLVKKHRISKCTFEVTLMKKEHFRLHIKWTSGGCGTTVARIRPYHYQVVVTKKKIKSSPQLCMLCEYRFKRLLIVRSVSTIKVRIEQSTIDT